MKLVVMNDVAIEEKKFFAAVRELLKNETGFLQEREEGDDIFSAFDDFLGDHYNAHDMWDFTEDDKQGAIEDFIDEFFSWVCDDYREVELQEL